MYSFILYRYSNMWTKTCTHVFIIPNSIMGLERHNMDHIVYTLWECNVDMAMYVFKYPLSPFCIWLYKNNRIGEISHILASPKHQTWSWSHVHYIDSISLHIGTIDNLIKAPSMSNLLRIPPSHQISPRTIPPNTHICVQNICASYAFMTNTRITCTYQYGL